MVYAFAKAINLIIVFNRAFPVEKLHYLWFCREIYTNQRITSKSWQKNSIAPAHSHEALRITTYTTQTT